MNQLRENIIFVLGLLLLFQIDVGCANISKSDSKRNVLPVLMFTGESGVDNEFEKKLVLHFNFDKINSISQSRVIDSSGFDNHGHLSTGGLILQIPSSSCLNAAYLDCADINLRGETFQAKPMYGVTISAWIHILNIQGKHSIFETYGLFHSLGQYHFEVDFGMLRWFHRNERQEIIYEVSAEGIEAKKWTHVLGTFNSSTGMANIFINGNVANRTFGRGLLSRDWGRVAHIGSSCSNRPLVGFVDEFKMFNYAAQKDQVMELSKSCNFKETAQHHTQIDGLTLQRDSVTHTNVESEPFRSDGSAAVVASSTTALDDILPISSETIDKRSKIVSKI